MIGRDSEVGWLENQVDTLCQLRDEYERAIVDQAETIERMVSELARSNSELEQFAYVASHDLQAPLRTVSSYVQLLEQRYADALDDRARKYIAYAVEGASRMQRLINDLLDFSRLQRAEVRRQAVDMDRVVENALANLQQQISESGARVEVEGPLPPVLGDEILLMRVVQNLVDNAIRYGGVEAPSVRISAAREADRWRFSVADQGAGIDPRFHERIFQVFQRLQGRDKTSGTGIGLAVVKKIVEQLGGKVRVESAPGQGATFHFTLSPKGES